MTTLARPTSVCFDEHSMCIELDDDRTLGVPLAWFPHLLHGSPAEREKVTLSPSGLHWETLDDDVSIVGILAGRGDATSPRSNAA
jgi:hypothetical protein